MTNVFNFVGIPAHDLLGDVEPKNTRLGPQMNSDMHQMLQVGPVDDANPSLIINLHSDCIRHHYLWRRGRS